MKYQVLLTFLACASFLLLSQTPSSSSAKSKCSLTRAQAPEIRGIRLGMTTQQLFDVFPENGNRQRVAAAVENSKRANNYGFGRFDLRAEPQIPNPRFTGVNYITIELLDERVTGFHIGYAGPEWKTVDQFVAKLSDGLGLPSSSWEAAGELRQFLKCDGFIVDAYASGESRANWVRVQDTSALRVVEDRRQTAKERERQAFRP